MYDKRPAHKLATLRVLKGHRLSERDRAELRDHAQMMMQFTIGKNAKLIRFHKRRKRSEWIVNNRRVILSYRQGILYTWEYSA